MSFNELRDDESNVPNLPDVLERLAGALEQQTRTLLELKTDVGGLADKLKQLENRLDGPGSKGRVVAGPKKSKASSRRRTK